MATGEFQIGDRIAGRFEVGEVHRGGMGIVYIAKESPEGREPRTVALKTLRDEFLSDPGRGRRFETECHLWVRLGTHPNLVRALALEEIEGRPFLLMEYVDGGELGGWIGTPRLDPRTALAFGVQFCLGMEQALRAGLACHRDIKPSNLLIARDGTLKIADFGLVRLREEFRAAGFGPDLPIPLDAPATPLPIRWTDPADRVDPPSRPEAERDQATVPDDPLATIDHPSGARTPPSRLTGTGWQLGTYPYMVPEQFADAGGADVRADIYAFGVVLFEMLTATRPFHGKTPAMLRREHERYAPPSVVAAIPLRYRWHARRIDAVVQRCLEKDPSDRFPSVVALRSALTRVLRRMDWLSWIRPG